ncbi:P-loop containing nucleoside triphosphate hydrolase protein [Hypoxylon sp. FL0890]|nr:P-loop containing nucleoside triphosphate hydrolase protein [Hypoxylon sp. FL0890]
MKSDEQRVLAVPTVKGFALESKKWCSFKIADISPITWNDGIFENLVLDNGEKELLLALVARTNASDHVSFDDFMKGKGKGLLLLLCGAPGIGKTLTAEAVAEKLRRPLYRIRAGDLGVTAEDVERSLKKALKLCTHSNAVLLIDEADIFLEQRSTDDIVRSELVSIFLVLLEYYEGIMILTTNRIECIDAAFESRIDIILAYKDLTQDTRRRIWNNFIRRLPPEAVSLSPEAIEDLSRWSVNGRQIKSSIKTGWTLSTSKGEPLRKEHLDLVPLRIREKGSKLLGIEDYGIRYCQESSGASELSSTGQLAYPDIDSDLFVNEKAKDLLYNDLPLDKVQATFDNRVAGSYEPFVTGVDFAVSEVIISKTYIVCEGDALLSPEYERVLAATCGEDLKQVSVSGGHSAFASVPGELVDILARLVEERTDSDVKVLLEQLVQQRSRGGKGPDTIATLQKKRKEDCIVHDSY